jgi:hypothetical protein
MNISITKKEFDAILFAISQIESALESSENEEWDEEAIQAIELLYCVCNKFKVSKAKAEELNEAKRYVRSQNHYLPPREVNKTARAVLKRKNELK